MRAPPCPAWAVRACCNVLAVGCVFFLAARPLRGRLLAQRRAEVVLLRGEAAAAGSGNRLPQLFTARQGLPKDVATPPHAFTQDFFVAGFFQKVTVNNRRIRRRIGP